MNNTIVALIALSVLCSTADCCECMNMFVSVFLCFYSTTLVLCQNSLSLFYKLMSSLNKQQLDSISVQVHY